MFLEKGSIIAGRYEILEKIGVGGMAIVYKAKDIKLDRSVTFKVMRDEFVYDEEFIARFNIEAQAAASLSNQNIVNVYDVGEDGDIHFIVMEYIEGDTLKELIRKSSPFDNEAILGVATQIASALEHAHLNNIVHRDIKPQNILVTLNGIIKVTDFGIARAATSSTMTTSSNAMGSVHYFSPEQARGGYVDFKSDLYSLGIVMFEMATGTLPFDGETAVSIALKQISDELPDIKDYNPNISESIVRIIQKTTEKSSAKRYLSTRELLNDLKRALTNTTGDFVSVNVVTESPTVMLSATEVASIKNELKNEPEKKPAPERKIELPKFEANKDARAIYFGKNNPMDDYDAEAEKRSERKIIIAAILTAILIMVVVGVAIVYIMRSRERALSEGMVSVYAPHLVGLSLMDAENALRALNLTLNASEEQFSDFVAAGSVMLQDIEENTLLSAGDVIEVVVSKGPLREEVPSVIGMDIEEALEFFRDNTSLTLRQEYETSEDYPIHVVFRQDPAPGEMVSPRDRITLYVSSGSETSMVIVPGIVGATESEAIMLLESAGLAAAHPTRMDSDRPEGEVIMQLVEAGTQVPRGRVVQYVISSGRSEANGINVEPIGYTRIIPINPPRANFPDGVEEVRVIVYQVAAAGTKKVFEEIVTITNFPIEVAVTGTGNAEIQVWVRDVAITARPAYFFGTEQVNFSEGA